MRSVCFWLFFGIASACNTAKSADLYCWIVADDNGGSSFTTTSVSNLIADVNVLYRQVALTFNIKALVWTNNSQLAVVRQSDNRQKNRLRSIGGVTGGLKMYFVKEFQGRATATYAKPGIIIGPRANARTLGHELGHACNLPDIYDVHRETSLVVSGFPEKARMLDDWGWYPTGVSQAEVLKRLLMYGYFSSIKADITFGDIDGLHYTSRWNSVSRSWDRTWYLRKAPIGFGRHGERNPISE